MKIGTETYVRVQDITVKEELLLRPIDEDHVARLTVQWKWTPSAAPPIIVQKVKNANFVRVHCHTFMALRRAGEERIRCRYIEGEEHEIRAYGLKEQSQIKDFTPQQYHDNIIIIRDALREKNGKCSLRDLEEFTHLKKSQIHKLVQGFTDDNVKELMDKGASFTKAYETVHLVDKPKVKEPPEDLTKSREASTEEDLDKLQTKGHLGTHSIPGAVDGKDGEAGAEEGISPDGGSDSSVGTPSITEETVPKTEPETPPSKPQPYTQEWMCWCGAHDPSKLELKKHDCINNGFQGYLGRIARDTGQMIQTSPKNGNEYWLKHPLFKQMAENPQSIVHIEQQAELQEHTWKKFKRALDNAKAKIGGS